MHPSSAWPSSTRLSEAHAPVLVCRDGVLLPARTIALPDPTSDWRKYRDHTVQAVDGLLVPSCRGSDILLPQPPLALTLDNDHVAALLRAEQQGILAATILGPPQEKKQNEDFAIAAGIVDRYRQDHSFIAVADGVTSKTFWAERASRIACFVALQMAMDYANANPQYSVDDIELFRKALSSRLRQALERDRYWLKDQAAVPQDWDTGSYQKFSGNDALWYNTTLLISLVGPNAAMILWSGDGAIYLRKDYAHGRSESSAPLRSTDDLNVDNVVSLGGPILFSGGRIETSGGLQKLTVTLCSDGPDRTLQRCGDRTDVFDVASSALVARTLDELTESENREVDNYSAAVVRWPIIPSEPLPRGVVDRLLWPPDAAPLRPITSPQQVSGDPSSVPDLSSTVDDKRPPAPLDRPIASDDKPVECSPDAKAQERPPTADSAANAIARYKAIQRYRRYE